MHKPVKSDWEMFSLPKQTKKEARSNVRLLVYGLLRVGMPHYYALMEDTEYWDTASCNLGFCLVQEAGGVMLTRTNSGQSKVNFDIIEVPYWKYMELAKMEIRAGYTPLSVKPKQGRIDFLPGSSFMSFVKEDPFNWSINPPEKIGACYISWLKKNKEELIPFAQLEELVRQQLPSNFVFPYDRKRS
jgi:hypothetical protein